VTPLNDSFVDFDLLAHIDTEGVEIKGPSVYSEMVWNARQLRAQAKLPPIDWIVLRNRMGAQNMVNKQKMESAIERLSRIAAQLISQLPDISALEGLCLLPSLWVSFLSEVPYANRNRTEC